MWKNDIESIFEEYKRHENVECCVRVIAQDLRYCQAVENDETSNLTTPTFSVPLSILEDFNFTATRQVFIIYARAKWKITGTLPVAFARAKHS